MMDTKRRGFIKLGLGAVGGLMLPGNGLKLFNPPVAEAKVESLNVLLTGGSFRAWQEKTFIIPFSKENNINTSITSGLFANLSVRVIAEKGNPNFDLLYTDQIGAMQLGSMGLLLELKESEISNLKDIQPAFKCPYAGALMIAPFGLTYNVKKSPIKVTSWLDLWNPAFEGRVAIPKWEWMGEAWFNFINKVLGGTEDNIDPGIKKCRELVRNKKAIMMDSSDYGVNLFVSEEIWIAPFYSARTAQAKKAGTPIEFVYPEEGGFCWWNNFALIAGRPKENRDMAVKFINYTLDPRKQLEFALLCGYPPANVKTMNMIPSDRMELLLTKEQMNNLGKIKMDYMKMRNNSDKNAERWNKEVLGG